MASFGEGEAVAYRGGEQVEGREEAGSRYLRVEQPGEKVLEGVRMALGTVEGGRVLTVHGRIRGSGTVGLMVQAANGWVRLPPQTLSSDWQELRVAKTLREGENRPVFYCVSMPKDVVPPPGSFFELADLKATLSAPVNLPDLEVRPQRVEMEDHAPNESVVGEEDGATGLVIKRSLVSTELPFPQTSRPVVVYARYRAGSATDRLQLCTRHGGSRQAVREVVPESQAWQWIAFEGLTPGEVGEQISFDLWPGADAARPAVLDAVVITTEAGLGTESLDLVK